VVYTITHRTIYQYESPVSVSQHLVHLHPRGTERQQVRNFSMHVDPAPTLISERIDYYGNAAAVVTIQTPHDEMVVATKCVVDVAPAVWPQAGSTPSWERVRELCASDVRTPDSATGEFLFDSPHVTRTSVFADYARASFVPGLRLLEGLQNITSRIFHDFRFDPRATTVATPLEEVFRQRRGVCQDFAHLTIACLRSIGLPARYVSGYLETIPPPGKRRLIGADASHAWVAAWCPGFGWIDIDPTNNVFPNERHVTVAWGRDFSDVSPLRGVVIGGGEHGVGVAVDVVPSS
jgi:transglutaminase-like putative cysteine protease